MQTSDQDNLPVGGDPSLWDDPGWDRDEDPIMNYDDEARKLFQKLNLPDPSVDNTEDQDLFSDASNMPNAVY